MSDDIIAIKSADVSKDFILPHEKVNSVKSLFTGITKRKSTKEIQHALRGISFEVKKGEFFGIVGRNGSGKSTLLKIMAGIYQPTSGKIETVGKIMPFIELGVGFNAELTGRENVYLNGAMLGFSENEVDAFYDDIVAFAELERFMDQKLKNYSSGMQVRLAFSIATRSEADILLVDEVLAVGDADFQNKCYKYFKQLKRDKKTVVFVTHSMDAVREYCDRVILIEDNEIKMEGDAEKIATAYSRMFFEEEERNQTRQDRWGNKKATISKVKITPNPVEVTEKSLALSMTITAHSDIDNPVVGFMIKNQAAQSILGSNSQIQKVKTGRLKKGEILEIVWTIPHIFARGVHYVDPSIIEAGTTEVYDWWQEAASFVVHRDKVTPYIVNPSLNLEVRNLKS